MLRLLVISVALSACVVPYAIPPLKAEAGGTSITGEKPLFHAGGGAHLASGTTRDPRFDVGVGGFVESNEDHVQTTASYVDASVFVDHSAHARTSIGVRGELRFAAAEPMADRERMFGAKLRVEREVFKATHAGYGGSDRCGAIGGGAHGTGGIGVFAEAGSVQLPDQRSAFTATAGLTLRVPSTVGAVLVIPGCR